MEMNTSTRIVGYLRIITIIVFLSLVGIYSATYILTSSNNQLYFLSSSMVLVVFAFLNAAYSHLKKDQTWSRYSLRFFIAMTFGFIGDLMMGGILFLTPFTLINGIIFFGVGHALYVIGLRTKSPLLYQSGSGPILRNIAVLLICIVSTIALFFGTVYNPYDFEMSMGALFYGALLASVLAFALTKSFEEFPLAFKVVLALGFLLFLISDWVLGVRYFASSDFLSAYVVGITYLMGQLLIQLSPIMGVEPEG